MEIEMIVIIFQHIDSFRDAHYDLFIAIVAGIIVSVFVQIVIIANRIYRRRKIIKYIRDVITVMFLGMEKWNDRLLGQRMASRARLLSMSMPITQLKEVIRINGIYLKPEQTVKLISILNAESERVDNLKQKNMSPENHYYRLVLDTFNEMEWLKIPIKRLNFKE